MKQLRAQQIVVKKATDLDVEAPLCLYLLGEGKKILAFAPLSPEQAKKIAEQMLNVLHDYQMTRLRKEGRIKNG